MLGTQREERRPGTDVWGGASEGQRTFCRVQGGGPPQVVEGVGAVKTPCPPAAVAQEACPFRAASTACGHSGRPGVGAKRQIGFGSGTAATGVWSDTATQFMFTFNLDKT